MLLARVVPSLLALFVLVSTTPAAPIILHGGGVTEPLSLYRETLVVESGAPAAAGDDEIPFYGLDRLFPVRTPEMTPGHPTTSALGPKLRQRLRALPRPLFLVGTDRLSQRWLMQHRDELRARGTVGLVIEADSFEAFEVIETMGRGLIIVPISASDLARELGLSHYPVLLSPEGLAP